MAKCISAVQHLRRLRGGSQPHLLRASGGASYVTKFRTIHSTSESLRTKCWPRDLA